MARHLQLVQVQLNSSTQEHCLCFSRQQHSRTSSSALHGVNTLPPQNNLKLHNSNPSPKHLTRVKMSSQPLTNYLPGFASLLEQIDKRVLVLLRDGRSLFGVLRSIDQFANLVLHLTIERIYIGDEYGEIERGVFLIRGENVVLCGEVRDDESESLKGYRKVPIEVILANQQRELEERSNRDKLKKKALQERDE